MSRMFFPHSIDFTTKSFVTDVSNHIFRPKLPEIINSFDLLNISSNQLFIDFPSVTLKPDLTHITKISTSQDSLNSLSTPSISNIVSKPEIELSTKYLDISDSGSQSFLSNIKSIIINNTVAPVHEWLEDTTFTKVIKVIDLLNEAYGMYSEIMDGLEDLMEESNNGINLDNTFFSGGIGNDTVGTLDDYLSINLDDIFYSTSESEIFNGGRGNDTVVYSGLREDYQIERGILGYKVSGINDNETDTLFSIERLEFSDASIDLELAGVPNIDFDAVYFPIL